MRRLAGALALIILTAGCIGAPDDAGTDADQLEGSTLDGDLEVAKTLATEAGNATLATPPVWETGQWWTYEVRDLSKEEAITATRVVVGQQDGQYLVGMPAEAWIDDLLILHLPGFTEVSATDLSFEVHDAIFKPLDFPLTDGKTWETGFHQAIADGGLEATATVTSPTTADVELLGPGGHIQLTYDAEVGTITWFEMESYPTGQGMTFEVVDHGTGYEGDVRLAYQQDVVLLQTHVGSVVDAMALGPAPPMRTVTVDGAYDRITLATLVGDLPVGGPEAPIQKGVYGLRVEAPTGETIEHVTTPTDGPGYHERYTHLDHPNGDWTITHLGAGAGITLVEGIAYQAYEVSLPNGPVLSAVDGQ